MARLQDVPGVNRKRVALFLSRMKELGVLVPLEGGGEDSFTFANHLYRLFIRLEAQRLSALKGQRTMLDFEPDDVS